MTILDHVGITMVIVMVKVNLNKIEEASFVDVVVVAAGDLLEESVEVVVANMDMIIVGIVKAATMSMEKYCHFLAMINF